MTFHIVYGNEISVARLSSLSAVILLIKTTSTYAKLPSLSSLQYVGLSLTTIIIVSAVCGHLWCALNAARTGDGWLSW